MKNVSTSNVDETIKACLKVQQKFGLQSNHTNLHFLQSTFFKQRSVRGVNKSSVHREVTRNKKSHPVFQYETIVAHGNMYYVICIILL